MHPKLLKSVSIFIYFSEIILIFPIILQKVHKKVTTFVILLSLLQHSFYIKSNNRAHKRSPPKSRKNENREGATSATSAASPICHSRHTLLDRQSKRGHLPEKILKIMSKLFNRR